MKRDAAACLGDMLDYALDARAFVAGMTAATFTADRKTQYAVLRTLEVIGEAASTFAMTGCAVSATHSGKRLRTSPDQRFSSLPVFSKVRHVVDHRGVLGLVAGVPPQPYRRSAMAARRVKPCGPLRRPAGLTRQSDCYTTCRYATDRGRNSGGDGDA